jgi:hypothetical protein
MLFVFVLYSDDIAAHSCENVGLRTSRSTLREITANLVGWVGKEVGSKQHAVNKKRRKIHLINQADRKIWVARRDRVDMLLMKVIHETQSHGSSGTLKPHLFMPTNPSSTFLRNNCESDAGPCYGPTPGESTSLEQDFPDLVYALNMVVPGLCGLCMLSGFLFWFIVSGLVLHVAQAVQ